MREIIKLKKMLEDEKIPFEFIERKELEGYQIIYTHKEKFVCSVIQHKYSYGNDVNLLEMLGLTIHDDVESYLSAEDVFEKIKWHYRKVN